MVMKWLFIDEQEITINEIIDWIIFLKLQIVMTGISLIIAFVVAIVAMILLISRLKVHPFVAKNLVSQSRGFTIAQLEKIYMLCFESDQWVKTGKMDDRTSMEVLLSACGQV